MGWFDGNPAHLWEHPPRGAGAPLRRVHGRRRRGAGEGARVVRGAATTAGSPRSSTTSSSPSPENAEARELQADALEQLGYGAENATWRNFFLMGAQELREGVSGTPDRDRAARHPPRLTVSQLLDAMAIRLDGPRAWEQHLRIDWVVTDPDEEHAITVRNGVLSHRPGQARPRGRRRPRRRARGAQPAPAQNRRHRRAGRERAPAGRGRRRQARRAARPARRARPGLRDRHPGVDPESQEAHSAVSRILARTRFESKWASAISRAALHWRS